MVRIAIGIAVAFAAFCFADANAQAGVNRAWVSGHGSDAPGCGAPTSPCRTFQYVVNSIINAGGEIDVLDPAGYGAVTVPFALSIVNDGVGVAGVQAAAGGNAITFNGGPNDILSLRGLNIEGLNTAANGIQFNSGALISLSDSHVTGFTQYGINFVSSSGNTFLEVRNSGLGENGAGDIYMKPTGGATGQYGYATIANSDLGGEAASPTILTLDTTAESGARMAATLSNCFIHGTPGTAISVNAPTNPAIVTINDSTLTQIGTTFVANGASALVGIDGSKISDTNTVVQTTNGGGVSSFGNNAIWAYTTLGALGSQTLQ